jgi:2-phospho-L-lactate guanylyltransferase (CobY/MobA/RfbA family)
MSYSRKVTSTNGHGLQLHVLNSFKMHVDICRAYKNHKLCIHEMFSHADEIYSVLHLSVADPEISKGGGGALRRGGLPLKN